MYYNITDDQQIEIDRKVANISNRQHRRCQIGKVRPKHRGKLLRHIPKIPDLFPTRLPEWPSTLDEFYRMFGTWTDTQPRLCGCKP